MFPTDEPRHPVNGVERPSIAGATAPRAARAARAVPGARAWFGAQLRRKIETDPARPRTLLTERESGTG